MRTRPARVCLKNMENDRDQILRLLRYPRSVLGTLAPLASCSHAGFLDPKDPGCHDCDYEIECAWLYSNDEFADLGEKPLSALLEALDYAAALIEAQITGAGHDSCSCACEWCAWVRAARHHMS